MLGRQCVISVGHLERNPSWLLEQLASPLCGGNKYNACLSQGVFVRIWCSRISKAFRAQILNVILGVSPSVSGHQPFDLGPQSPLSVKWGCEIRLPVFVEIKGNVNAKTSVQPSGWHLAND